VRILPIHDRALRAIRVAVAALAILAAMCCAVPPSPAQDAAPAQPSSRPLVLEAVEVEGATRTTPATVALFLPLRPGDAVDQERLLAGIGALRASGLFATVDFHTRPGAERGRVVLVIEVTERPVEVRLGTGNTDLDGWYLIPAELSLDNRLGRGEQLDLQLRFGYRVAGLALRFAEPRAGDGRTFWGAEAAALGTQRLYFVDGIEYDHRVERARFSVHAGRRLSRFVSAALGLRLETVEADSSAQAHADDAARGVERGDDLPYERLPAGVAAGVGRRERSVVSADLVLDSRDPRLAAGSPAAGAWGRVRLESALQGDDAFGAAELDLRAYRAALGGALAVRLRGAVVGDDAPFYDRLYLGGLYTVRGFPGQSLSDPAGDTWLWSGSLEWRAPLVGDPSRPRLAGVLFVDAGDSGREADPRLRDLSVGAGWGLRLRVGWLGWLGLDLATPLSHSPVDDALRAHASLGWAF